MFNLKEYQTSIHTLADRLVWAAMVDKAVVLNKTGSLMQSFSLVGHDLESVASGEINYFSEKLEQILQQYGSGWCFYYDLQREESVTYPAPTFSNAAALLVDAERQAMFEQNGAFFESRIYLTVVYMPPVDSKDAAKQLFISNPDEPILAAQRHLLQFKEQTKQLGLALRTVFKQVHVLENSALLEYLHRFVSNNRQPIKLPHTTFGLDYLLTDCELIGGLEPKLGQQHLFVLSVKHFPEHSFAEMLGGLNELDIEFRWTTRFITLDKAQALAKLEACRKNWTAKGQNIFKLLHGAMTNTPVTDDNAPSEARLRAQELAYAKEEVKADATSFGYYTTTIVVKHADFELGQDAIQQVKTVLQDQGLVCVLERINSVEAWLGSLPGHAHANVRLPMLAAANFVHLLTLSCAWAGQASNQHFARGCSHGHPLLIAQTLNRTPFRGVFHDGDVGHTLVVGPSGAGKSTFLNLAALQFLRYDQAQVIWFDKGYSAKVATHAVGGQWLNLMPEAGERSGLQPLAGINEPGTRAWALSWLEGLLVAQGLKLTVELRQRLSDALCLLTDLPVKLRTLATLQQLVQDKPLRLGLQPYTEQGELGFLFDSDSDIQLENPWLCLEMGDLMSQAKAELVPMLDCLFHKLRRQFSGVPTLLILDEFWEYAAHPHFQKLMVSWLKTERKNNVSVWLASQSLQDMQQDANLCLTIKQECPTRVFLPNPAARDVGLKQLYLDLGLSAHQVAMVQQAVKKQHYYIDCPSGSRLIDLNLGPIALAFAAQAGKQVACQADSLLNQVGRANFAAAWLQKLGLQDAANLLQEAQLG